MFEIILSASAMIVLGALLRLFAINRLPKFVFVLIWGLVSIRLLIPFSIPGAWNILNVIDVPRVEIAAPNIAPHPDALTIVYGITSAPQSAQPFAQTALIALWIAGGTLLALYFMRAHYKFRKEMKESLPVEHALVKAWLSRHKSIRPISVRQSDKIRSPLTYGVFRPVILLPAEASFLDDDKLRYILAHEDIHIRRFDYVWKFVFAAVLCIYWFHPLVWLMYVLANRDIELSCDEAVLKRFGQKSRTAYGLTLLDMADKKRTTAFVYNGFSKHALAERVKALANVKRKSAIGAIAALALVVGAMTAFAVSPDEFEYDVPDEEPSVLSEARVPLEDDADAPNLFADEIHDLTYNPPNDSAIHDEPISEENSMSNPSAEGEVSDIEAPSEPPDTEGPAHGVEITPLSYAEFEVLVLNYLGRSILEEFLAVINEHQAVGEFGFYLEDHWEIQEDGVRVDFSLISFRADGVSGGTFLRFN
jgi:beta-lactamase regulating signal transducer with metallopeptidase domain